MALGWSDMVTGIWDHDLGLGDSVGRHGWHMERISMLVLIQVTFFLIGVFFLVESACFTL